MNSFVQKYIVGFYDESRPITVLYARTLFLSLALCVFWLAVFWTSRIFGFKVDIGFVQIDMNKDNFVEYFCQEFSKYMFLSILLSTFYFSIKLFINFNLYSSKSLLIVDDVLIKIKKIYFSKKFVFIGGYKRIFIFYLFGFIVLSSFVYFISNSLYVFLNSYSLYLYIYNFGSQNYKTLFIYSVFFILGLWAFSVGIIINLSSFYEAVFFKNRLLMSIHNSTKNNEELK